MPLSRVLEPEEMAGADEAAEYDAMDFSSTDDAVRPKGAAELAQARRLDRRYRLRQRQNPFGHRLARSRLACLRGGDVPRDAGRRRSQSRQSGRVPRERRLRPRRREAPAVRVGLRGPGGLQQPDSSHSRSRAACFAKSRESRDSAEQAARADPRSAPSRKRSRPRRDRREVLLRAGAHRSGACSRIRCTRPFHSKKSAPTLPMPVSVALASSRSPIATGASKRTHERSGGFLHQALMTRQVIQSMLNILPRVQPQGHF